MFKVLDEGVLPEQLHGMLRLKQAIPEGERVKI
jgi:hypothetical protein